MKKKVIVIGGGPAGMICAGVSGSKGHDVILIEKNEDLGKKLLITGKGRCNITNNCDIEEMISNVTVNAKFLYSAFYSFTNQDVVDFFNNLGLKTKLERGGRIFPESDKAQDVLSALKKYLKLNGVKVINKKVKQVISKDNIVEHVLLEDGEKIYADSVIIATGGKSYPQTGSSGDGYAFAKENGHTITKLIPSLVPLVTYEIWTKNLTGLTLKNVAIKIVNEKNKKVYEDFGEMNFNSYGVSGPIILSASCYIKDLKKNKYKLLIDLKPALSEEQLDRRLQRDFEENLNKAFKDSLGKLLPKQMIAVILKLSSIDEEKKVNQISKKERYEFIKLLKNLPLYIKDYRPIEDAIVTSGGISVKEINSSTMESKIIKGLFFAGELIDVDAYTGGFNLQIAFSTGYLAGINC